MMALSQGIPTPELLHDSTALLPEQKQMILVKKSMQDVASLHRVQPLAGRHLGDI